MLPQCVSSCSECYIRVFLFYVFLFSFIWHKNETHKKVQKQEELLSVLKISSRFHGASFFYY